MSALFCWVGILADVFPPSFQDRSIRTFDSKTLEPLLVLGGSNPNVGVLAENHRLDADIPGPLDIEGHRAAVNAIELVKDYM